MRVQPEDREVFRRIGEAESMVREPPASFTESLSILEELLVRQRAMFPDRPPGPTDEEFCAHEALYARARILGTYRR